MPRIPPGRVSCGRKAKHSRPQHRSQASDTAGGFPTHTPEGSGRGNSNSPRPEPRRRTGSHSRQQHVEEQQVFTSRADPAFTTGWRNITRQIARPHQHRARRQDTVTRPFDQAMKDEGTSVVRREDQQGR